MYRVLLVDDWEIFLTETKRLKVWGEESGFEAAASAANGKEALELLHREKFDLVLTDIRMPVMDGLEASRLIRALERPDARSVPIVAMSANAFEEDMKKSMESGMNAHLAKPFQVEELVDTLNRIIAGSR